MSTKMGSLAALALASSLAGCGPGKPPEGAPEKGAGTAAAPAPEKVVLRVGHFPNVTHAQGLIANASTRKGKGWFEERLGPGVEVQWFVYNAGPSAMEAIFAGSLDFTYVGPNPALNAYMKSRGEEIRIIRGAAVGGSALVVQGDDRIRSNADFRGKKVATPQLGNTQDVACRSWLLAQGFKVTQLGGDVSVLPTANPDQLTLFRKGDIDAVWTVEPWVSRLVLEAKGKILLDEPHALTTILVASVKILRERRDLVRKFAGAHSELTAWMEKNPAEAQKVVMEEIEAETRGKLSPKIVESSWSRLRFTGEISRKQLEECVAAAKGVGFIRESVDLSRLVEEP